MNFKTQQLKGVEIHGAPQVGTRTVNILMGEHANEFVRGDIMDANAVLQAFDELKGDVDTNHDTLEELVNEIHANTDDIKVERNRAIAKENSIIDKIDNLKYMPYVSKANMSSSELGNFTEYNLGATNFIISAMHGSNDARTEFDFGLARFISVSKNSSASIDYESVRVGKDNNIRITNTGIRKYINANNPSGSATEAFSTNGGVIDTTAFALKSELDSYAKKTDIPEVNTSDFVSKTTTDNQSIKSELSVYNSLHIVDSSNTNNNTTITCDGIFNTDNNANHVYATDGSIADLTKYIKIDDAYLRYIPYYGKHAESGILRYLLADKEGIELRSYGVITKLLGSDIAISSGSEDLKLTRSGININSYGDSSNHFNVEVNSTPRLNLWNDQCNISANVYDDHATIGIRNHNYGLSTYDLKLSADGIEMLSKTTKDIVTANNSTAHIGLDDDLTEYTYVAPLENGKVPAEYLDLSLYVLKSVYDEKIAALEARIAALESKHPEAAA